MAQAPQLDAQGNPIVDPNNPPEGAPSVMPDLPAMPEMPGMDPASHSTSGIGTGSTGGGYSLPQMPAPDGSGPTLPEFGQGDGNAPMPFEPPSDASLVDSTDATDPYAAEESSVYGQDPTAPGGRYSGGPARRANPLRESNVGKQLALRASGGKQGLTGGGLTAPAVDESSAGGGSDLLLQLLQLLGQEG